MDFFIVAILDGCVVGLLGFPKGVWHGSFGKASGVPPCCLHTVRDFETVNGVKARGGTLNGAGPVVAGGMVLVGSGYGRFGQVPGNVLICLSVDGR